MQQTIELRDSKTARELTITGVPRRPNWARWITGRRGARSLKIWAQTDDLSSFVRFQIEDNGRMGIAVEKALPRTKTVDFRTLVAVRPTSDVALAKLLLGKRLWWPPYTMRGLYGHLEKKANRQAPRWKRWLRLIKRWITRTNAWTTQQQSSPPTPPQ